MPEHKTQLHKRNGRWLRDLYLVLIIFCTLGVGLLAYTDLQNFDGLVESEANARLQSVAHKTGAVILDQCSDLTLPSRDACIADQLADQRSEMRAEYDLMAQMSMARFGWWMLIVAIVQAVIGAGGFLFIARTVDASSDAVEAAQEANIVSRQMAESQSRAYLSVVRCDLAKGKFGTAHEVALTLSNSGATPAKNIRYRVEAVLLTDGTADEFSPTFERDDGGANTYYIGNIASNERTKVKCPAVFGITRHIRDAIAGFPSDYAKTLEIHDFPVVVIKGLVKYEDVFDNRFVSHFAYRIEMEQRPTYFDAPNLSPIGDKVPSFVQV